MLIEPVMQGCINGGRRGGDEDEDEVVCCIVDDVRATEKSTGRLSAWMC